MNANYRKEESTSPNVPFRTDRFFCANGDWYFSIRRGPDQGPYASKEEAQHALQLFIEDQSTLEKQLRAERDIMQGIGRRRFHNPVYALSKH